MKNILILSHTTDLIGPTEHLLDFVNCNSYNCYSAIFPFHYTNLVKKEFRIKKNKYYSNLSFKNEFFSIIFDSLSILIFVFYLSFFKRIRFDLAIGINPLNCFLILILNKLKIIKTKKTVLYTIDWIEKRYPSNLLNKIYHFINKFSVKHSNQNWIVSEKIITTFKNIYGVKNEYVHIPIGCRYKNINKTLSKNSIINLCYVGYFHTDKGIDLLIRNIDKITKINNKVNFYFYGKSPGTQKSKFDERYTYEQILEKMSLKYNISFSFFDDIQELDKNLEKMHIGFAIFNEEKTTISNYSDPSKVKDYISNNILTLINSYNPISKEIEKYKLGFVLNYDDNELLNFFKKFNYKIFNENQKHLSEYSYKNSWSSIYKRALENLKE